MNYKDKIECGDDIYSIFNINLAEIAHLPYSLRVLLENYIRNNPQSEQTEAVIHKFIEWNGKINDPVELTFFPSRVIMQDFTGVPAVVDLASMRDAVKKLNGDPSLINPQCQTDLVIDHDFEDMIVM